MMDQLLTAFARIIAPASAAFFALTVVYEWGYFRAVGRQFQSLLTTTDYVANAIVALPSIVVMLFIFWESEPSERTRWRYGLPLTILLFLLSVGAVGFLFYTGTIFAWLGMAFMFLPLWQMGLHAHGGPASPVLFSVVRAVPPLLVGALAIGWWQGTLALAEVGDVYTVAFKHDGVERRVNLLRSLEKGVIVRDVLAQRVIFYRWDDVSSLSRPASVAPSPPACSLFGWNCPGAEVVP